MSIEAIATAARVSKATIYRRWGSKDALILDLVAGAVEEPLDVAGGAAAPQAGSGDARADLLAWVRAGLEAESSPRGAALEHLVRRAAEDPALAARLQRRVLGQHLEGLSAILERGVRAGQLRPHLDAVTLLDLLCGPLLYQSLIRGSEPPTRDPAEHARAIVDLLWPGIRAKA